MRWKTLRRRFAGRAPRMILRSRLAWPLRWVIAALALGLCAALAVWAFEFGKGVAGVDGDSKAELAQLRSQMNELRAQRDRAQSLADVADSLIKAERAANERLAQDMRALEDRKQALDADLRFFERLLPTDGQPLQLRALLAETLAPGQVRYQMLVMQPGKDAREFSGRYDITLVGTLASKSWTMTLPNGPLPLKLRQYTRVEGVADYPREAVIKRVQAQLTDLKGVVQATESVTLP